MLRQISLLAGRTAAQKQSLFAELRAALQTALQAPAESIRILLNEIPRANEWHAATPGQGAPSSPLKSTENQ